MTPRYRIEVTPAARRALESLPKKVLKQIDKRVLALADNPYPPGSEKLQDTADLRRIRVGDYRIVYIVGAERLVVVAFRTSARNLPLVTACRKFPDQALAWVGVKS